MEGEGGVEVGELGGREECGRRCHGWDSVEWGIVGGEELGFR